MSSDPEGCPAVHPTARGEIKRAAAGLAAAACAWFILTEVNDPVAKIIAVGILIFGLAAFTDAGKTLRYARRTEHGRRSAPPATKPD